MFFFLGPLGGPIRKALGIPTLNIPGTSFDFYNVFDAPKKTSASNIACNLCLCLCCAMMVKNLMSFPFKTPPVLVCLAIACCCSGITTKNLYDEGVARFPQGAAPTSEAEAPVEKEPEVEGEKAD